MGQNRMRNEIKNKFGFENIVETSFINGIQELVILFLMIMNNISHSLLVITIPI
jgi:hypothetical protein